jgi:hypothetical protein
MEFPPKSAGGGGNPVLHRAVGAVCTGYTFNDYHGRAEMTV